MRHKILPRSASARPGRPVGSRRFGEPGPGNTRSSPLSAASRFALPRITPPSMLHRQAAMEFVLAAMERVKAATEFGKAAEEHFG